MYEDAARQADVPKYIEDMLMTPSDYVIDVNEADFQYEVLQFSHNKPVVVDFWASWCKPCETLGPILEQLIQNGAGEFRLAKVDVDENPNLALRYNVRSIPAVKGFRRGQIVAEFSGIIPEADIQAFMQALAPSALDLMLLKGESLLELHRWEAAEKAFREVLNQPRLEPAALLGLAKCLLAQNQAQEAVDILRNFPDSREYAAAQKMRPLANALANTEPQIDDFTLEAMYLRTLRLVKMGNFPAAMDGQLDVLRQDKRYRKGEVREVLVGIFEILGEEAELTRTYRRELASVLF